MKIGKLIVLGLVLVSLPFWSSDIKPAVGQAPQAKHFRGAVPTPRHRLISAPRFVVPPTPLPASYGVIPSQLSYWLNDQYGDCVTAEEAFAKACYSVQIGLPELLIPDATVKAWAKANGVLNGADLTEVMDAMASNGFTVNGTNYTDGSYSAVDYTNDAVLSAAILVGPVKIGVAADQLENVVGTKNGWFGTGFRNDNSEDHCVSLCGFGTTQSLATMLGVQLPSGVNPSGRAYFLFTWDTIGIIEQASMVAITGEAWVRNPTTPQQIPPVPTPTPTPTPTPVPPTPTPNPVPSPTVVTVPFGVYTLSLSVPAVLVSPPNPVTVMVGNLPITISATMASSPALTVKPSPQMPVPAHKP